MIATFEEKQFESAVTSEIARGSLDNQVYSSGQVLEHILGYDAAADAQARHIIWKVLDIPRPRGVTLLPRHWPVGSQPRKESLPGQMISLIFQYKRPEYMTRSNSLQWTLWNAPYYRFERSPLQHNILRSLERQLGAAAVVRYAAPAFHRLADLELAQISGMVLKQTGFVRPSTIGSHTVWTYRSPGNVGRGNPSGPRRRFESLAELAAGIALPSDSNSGQSVERLLEQHAEAARYRAPDLRVRVDAWLGRVEASVEELDALQVKALGEYAAIQSACAIGRADWWLTSVRD